ncbi:MAG: type II toxin-antitoxin system HicB family antitoxin [Deltaproteobacteria bacterium]|nr:type II toxin-antitoxin system HicB family antitoxin [Deltaproteobacteria bacterium]
MICFQAKIYKDGKYYSVEFPDLQGCLSQGKTEEDALENAREALSLYLEEARNPQWNIPKPKHYRGSSYHWIYPYEYVAIALMIRQARLNHGLSQNQLAERLKITVQQLQKLETPGKSNPTVKTLASIAKALNEDLEIKLAA